MNERDFATVMAMKKMGGSFVRALGNLALAADAGNLVFIKEKWPGYWAKYEELGRSLEALEVWSALTAPRTAALALPRFVFCRDCGQRTEWTYSQGELVCVPAHHIVATFEEAAS